jgi:mono/diheme cytochrome c family protein
MRENYDRYFRIGLGLTLALAIASGLYWILEPSRMAAAAERLNAGRVERGQASFRENCVACHGADGEGVSAPALNDKTLLDTVSDELLFSLIRSGVPGTAMPSWGQANGGPFTDEEIRDLLAFIRSWQPTAPAAVVPAHVADPAQGAAIFASTCFVCHGPEGRGGRAPALNDRERLQRFDDEWFRQTISFGRPAKGMPTWGTVLSPEQIEDLVALLAAWRRGEQVTAATPANEHLEAVVFALSRGDAADAEFHLSSALTVASPLEAAAIRTARERLASGDLEAAAQVLETGLAGLLPGDPQQGQQLYAANCEVCHGIAGAGGLGTALAGNPTVQGLNDESLLALILTGRPAAGMPAWEGRLTSEEIQHIIALMRTWQ